tara:strand:- start:1096 stop:1857 length:762 start_codon:yes stop_codon:yes gene_type:complete
MLDRPTSHGGWPEGENRGWLPGSKPVNQQIGDYLTSMGLAEATIKIPDGPGGEEFEYKINSFEDLDLDPDIKEYLNNLFATNDPAYTQQALELLMTLLGLSADNLTQSEIEDYVDENLSEVIRDYLDREWHGPNDRDDRQIHIDDMVERVWIELDDILDELMATIVGLSLIENPPFGGNPMGIDPDQSFSGLQKAINVLYGEKFNVRKSPSEYKMDPDIALAKFIREMTFLNSGYITWEMIEKELREAADELW